MPRSALLVSLTLHGALLCAAGWWTFTVIDREGEGGADAAFLLDAGPLLATAAEPPAPVVEPQVAEPEFVPPPPPPVTVVEPPPVTPLTMASAPVSVPLMEPPETRITPPKAVASKSRKPPAKASAPAGGQAAGGSGAGLSGRTAAGYFPPQFRMRYKPPYPPEARAQRLEGTVMLLVSIDNAGHVTGVELLRSCGHSVLDQAALSAVRSWRFDPARQGGVAVAARAEVPVRFRFEGRGGA